ncbi:MAG TPA: Cof-type HAD-IIB family hydrolase [Ktedonobacteraceae bacterium]
MEATRKSSYPGAAPRAVRLIATDLDGTLLRSDGSLSQRTIAALGRVQEAGIVVVLVSARPPRIVERIGRAAGIGGLAICCNGALLYDLDRSLVLASTTILPDAMQWITATLRQAMPGMCFAVENGLSVICEPGYYACKPHSSTGQPRVADLSACAGEPVVKLMAIHPERTPDELREYVHELLGASYSVTHSGSDFLEIAPVSVHKAAALANLCQRVNIDASEVIAFGDMPNDLPMLQWAGRGVAVANAHPLVLQTASEITLSNLDDGVALVLEQLISPSNVVGGKLLL